MTLFYDAASAEITLLDAYGVPIRQKLPDVDADFMSVSANAAPTFSSVDFFSVDREPGFSFHDELAPTTSLDNVKKACELAARELEKAIIGEPIEDYKIRFQLQPIPLSPAQFLSFLSIVDDCGEHPDGHRWRFNGSRRVLDLRLGEVETLATPHKRLTQYRCRCGATRTG